MKRCSFAVQTRPAPPLTPPKLQLSKMQSFTLTGGEWGMWGSGAAWRTGSCLHGEKARTRQREREREKVHPFVFFPPTPPLRNPGGLMHCHWWARGERRGGLYWSGISGDQSVFWSVIRSSEWVQPPLSPLPTPVALPSALRHQPPYQSSRTCRQRWPPLALHCQRMMQQRHRRWPPPCTEGGGVTGAK